jgi:hypothetical protein
MRVAEKLDWKGLSWELLGYRIANFIPWYTVIVFKVGEN